MNDEELLRYSRHVLLPQIGIEGQDKIGKASVLVVGAGGLGCPAVLYLAASGVGKLLVADGDQVELTNLQRQIGHRTVSIGRNKADSLSETAGAINPLVQLISIPERLEERRGLINVVADVDVVVDCSDNFATRHAINRACVAEKTPLVSGAAIGFSGQLSVYDKRNAESPCYACLFPEQGPEEELRCSDAGVFSPLVGVIGALQALEALKLIALADQSVAGKLLLFEGLGMTFREVRVPRDPACPACKVS
ncbi:MAG: molybdopterin-synthase adenylyltransferase MoeB [Thiobacillaceae bacterium]|jgi:molybdopterin/thiamine biosynthesis adenylyltransferase